MLFEISEKAEKEISKYSDDYEVYLELEKILQLDAQKNDLTFAKEEINMGIGIRIISENKLGFAYSSDINKIEDVAKKAYLNSKLNEADENFCFAQKTKLDNVKNIYDSKFEKLDVNEASEFLESILETCVENNCEPTSGSFAASLENNLVTNSNGVSVFNKYTDFSAFVSINAEENGEKSTAYDSISSCNFDLDGEKLAKETCKIAKDSIGGVNVETKDTKVILDYRGAVGLLNTFINAFNADNVQRGRSILRDKIEKSIVDNNISIYDDGTLEGGLNSSISDSEGVKTEKTCLVEDGVLKSFIYDIYTAKKENSNKNSADNVKSTANGFRGSYAGTPSIFPSNIIFDFKEQVDISEIENGFLATDVLGAHTANPISGDFSVEANNAFLIDNGEISKPVKKAMISGNIFQALSDCNGVKSELRQYGSFLIPKILFNSLRVVG